MTALNLVRVVFVLAVGIPWIAAAIVVSWLRDGAPMRIGRTRCAHGRDCKCYLGAIEAQAKHTTRR